MSIYFAENLRAYPQQFDHPEDLGGKLSTAAKCKSAPGYTLCASMKLTQKENVNSWGIMILPSVCDGLWMLLTTFEAHMTPDWTRTCSESKTILKIPCYSVIHEPQMSCFNILARFDCVVSFILLLMVTSGCHCVIMLHCILLFVSCWTNCNKQNVTCEYEFSIMGLSKHQYDQTHHR